MHVNINIPRWILFSLYVQQEAFAKIAPFLELHHLSSLTIELDGLDRVGARDARIMLSRRERIKLKEATTNMYPADKYNIRTTYADVIEFATQLNCIITPNLCDGKHDSYNFWCLRSQHMLATLGTVPKITCDVSKIVIPLKTLHNEGLADCGDMSHTVYPWNNHTGRWGIEPGPLLTQGWGFHWEGVNGISLSGLHDAKPTMFIWAK